MAIISRSQLKAWFRRGLFPIESQFHAWIDSFWHKEDTIPISSIENLSSSLNNKADTADLARKADQSHKHVLKDITDYEVPVVDQSLDQQSTNAVANAAVAQLISSLATSVSNLQTTVSHIDTGLQAAIQEAQPTDWLQLRDDLYGNDLKPGQWYRIVDYLTEVHDADGNACSARHRFDLLVMATSESSLSEHALATKHDFSPNETCLYVRLDDGQIYRYNRTLVSTEESGLLVDGNDCNEWTCDDQRVDECLRVLYSPNSSLPTSVNHLY